MANTCTETLPAERKEPDRKEIISERYPGRVVTHERAGIWDHYEERDPDGRVPLFLGIAKQYSQLRQSSPYVVRLIKDVLSIPGCKPRLCEYVVTEHLIGLVPALSLWYQSRLVEMLEVALRTGKVDTRRLLRISISRILCTVASMLLQSVRARERNALNMRIRRWFALHTFMAYARLDVPTFGRREIKNKLSSASDDYGQTVMWQTLRMTTENTSLVTHFSAQAFVLFKALQGHQGGRFLALVALMSETMSWLTYNLAMLSSLGGAWAITTKNQAFLKLHGWKATVKRQKHRKELVAGNLFQFAVSEYKHATEVLGEDGESGDEVEYDPGTDAMGLLREFLAHVPQIAFTVMAFRNPANMPGSLVSLNLVQGAARSFAASVYSMINRSQSIVGQFSAVRDFYEIMNIPNEVPDGDIPLVFNSEDTPGVALEFRNVSFKYPDASDYALHNVSFSMLPGQLCVIVGSNGAGKSTILKLIVRLYDPQEGQILIGGHDIRTLKLGDLREAISVLFQDYTHFPLSIRDNIALGDPTGGKDEERVREAARLGGAESLIDKLPDGLDTFLERPSVDQLYGPPEGSKTVLGKPFDICAVRDAAGIKASSTSELSGGQMQRLAVARTFMRSVVRKDARVALLLFDEPSASLDPAAEHDLFDRLRELRGSKTMVFSSHRFGNLTRHADLILYMDDSGIVESGTHGVLLQNGGEYARLWKLQAQAFI
ncbi:HlyB/MsbA family ABC transporter [Lentinus tigrinus ALCF2SS1-7]|uniref:HlyB/MsbA family ABC transporter n=1 Tax=Lentinus tigrinus ALCF2SS1-6 TaxID=1328759 RepID=A0A5C2RYT1_9APHY|nr:HlyB/MsbA family ABC transporter [Lentinus tigrinus ALCF2SS1-6]RPD71015.1 HlyB/MsbA family ABC transporter [Lentinus tigrinus ALCF2SS1-7]